MTKETRSTFITDLIRLVESYSPEYVNQSKERTMIIDLADSIQKFDKESLDQLKTEQEKHAL